MFLPKPLTQRLHEAHFGVHQPAEPFPEGFTTGPHRTSFTRPTPEPVTPPEDILARLLKLKPESAELKRRLAEITGQLAPLLAAADEVEKAIADERQQSLQVQHREIRAQGRKQLRLVLRIRQELKNAEAQLLSAISGQQSALNAFQELAALEQRGQHVPRWATDEELAAWQAKIKRAQARVEEANECAAVALREREEIRLQLGPAETELARLGGEEHRVREQIAGKTTFLDPEYGLFTTRATEPPFAEMD